MTLRLDASTAISMPIPSPPKPAVGRLVAHLGIQSGLRLALMVLMVVGGLWGLLPSTHSPRPCLAGLDQAMALHAQLSESQGSPGDSKHSLRDAERTGPECEALEDVDDIDDDQAPHHSAAPDVERVEHLLRCAYRCAWVPTRDALPDTSRTSFERKRSRAPPAV